MSNQAPPFRPPPRPQIYEGRPDTVGADIFIDVVMPIVRDAAHTLHPQDLVLLYAGFISAAYGSLTADFGQETANLIFEGMLNAARNNPPLDNGRTH